MDWKEIKGKYPGAFKILEDWIGISFGEDEFYYMIHPMRYLYDFFDEQGIYIGLDYHYAIGIERWFSISFTWGKMDYLKIEHFIGTRTEAEEAAFLKAFEILESDLKNK